MNPAFVPRRPPVAATAAAIATATSTATAVAPARGRARARSQFAALALALAVVAPATPSALSAPGAPYDGWRHSGSMFVLTTPDGANLPASALEKDFPLLVRLDAEWFDFKQAKPDGSDLRFSTADGTALAYQIEEWAPDRGTASIWVRVPEVRGNARQEIRAHWGRPEAASESNGKAVFNASNGFLSVWHFAGGVADEVGTLECKDVGTTATRGQVGPARHLAGRQGIFGGDKIEGFPVGASPHSSEMWLRAEKSNGRAMAWGNEHGQGKVVMHFQSPPHVKMECYFSGADVSTTGRLPLNEWIHVVHTYQQGDSRVYVNGELSGVSARPNAPLAIKSPARLWIGGWYHNYDFVGDVDEVRVSKVVRSPDWVKLQHENQKANPTLTGPIVQPGSAFSVEPAELTILEGAGATLAAQAGGAQKVSWSIVQDGRETVVATDRFRFRFEPGRVTNDATATLRFTAVYPDGRKTRDIPVTIREAIPEPIFTLDAPRSWDGRRAIEVLPRIRNLAALKAAGAGDIAIDWKVSPFAVIKEVQPGKLLLTRAQNSGTLTVTATLRNGGAPVTQQVTLDVKEPRRDAWVPRVPGRDEKPEDGQFYARDDRNQGTLHYNGTLDAPADEVFLRLYADDKLVRTERARPARDRSYALAVPLKPGLIHYRVEFGTRSGREESVRHTVTNLVCGDAYIIDGQSNALATDTGEKSPAETSEWIRSYGRPSGRDAKAAPGNLWCYPVWKAEKGEKAELGWWGMVLAKRLVERQKIPVFIINAAVGGTRIDQHQRNEANPTDLSTIYGRMLWRVQQAKLTHGIRAILWHQGENDQGADGPTGGYGWETYHDYFIEMAAGWKRDFPNVQRYYACQIWPDSCSMGGRNGSGDMLREQQRTLPRLFSNLSVMSTLGIEPPGGCHFPLEGWARIALLLEPLLERDHYGFNPPGPITPPNLRQARFASPARDSLVLEFDQPVAWSEALAGQFYLDGEKGRVVSGRADGPVLTLQLKEPSTATKVTYLKESAWSQKTLLKGLNGIAALTFANVPIAPAPKR